MPLFAVADKAAGRVLYTCDGEPEPTPHTVVSPDISGDAASKANVANPRAKWDGSKVVIDAALPIPQAPPAAPDINQMNTQLQALLTAGRAVGWKV